MRVILLEDVPNVAKAGEIEEVADGYGRNFLIPRKLALLAKPGIANEIEVQRQIQARQQEKMQTDLQKLASDLEGKEFTLKAKVGATEKLYGSITTADIAAELENATGAVIDKKKIELDEPIRQLGSYEVVIKLARDIAPTIKVTVTEREPE